MKTRKWPWFALGVLLGVPVLMGGGWILTEIGIRATSGQAFCATCHGMQPFVDAYAEDTHGGHNPRGLTAPCVGCHLPHDTPTHYLLAKIRTGSHDIWAHLLGFFREPQWLAKLDQRESFVHDSGCLACHAGLQRAPNQQPTASLAHQGYFAAPDSLRCVTCHAQVGHKDLRQWLVPQEDPARATTPAATGKESTP